MEEKYYEILRHYVNPNDCATVVRQLLSLHNDSVSLKQGLAAAIETASKQVTKGTLCECKKHSLKTNYGFEICTKCGNEFDD